MEVAESLDASFSFSGARRVCFHDSPVFEFLKLRQNHVSAAGTPPDATAKPHGKRWEKKVS